jgi:hypothetical protein
MIPEIGHYALILALFMALAQGTLPLVGAHRGDGGLMALARPAAEGQLLFIVVAFAALTWSYVTSDFSVANVVANSHSAKPLIYKISGVDLQDQRRLGQSRGLDAVVGPDPRPIWRRGRGVRRQSAAGAACPCARRPGVDRYRLPAVHPADLESIRPCHPAAWRRP